MTKNDYMIACGDFGCVWNGDKSDDPQLDRLEALPFTVLFVDGNHENFDALKEYPVEQWHGGMVHKIRPHVIHLMRGQAFEARQMLERLDWKVDYIITHCAPTAIQQKINADFKRDKLTDFLEEVRTRSQFHYWLFGHYHDNRIIDEKYVLLYEQMVRIL